MLVRLPLSTCHQPETQVPSSLFFIGCQAGLLGNGLNYYLGFQKHSKADLDLDLQNAAAHCVSFFAANTG